MTTNVVNACVFDQQVDPFREHRVHVDALKQLKHALVRLGLRGDRQSLKLARRLFSEIPGLREA